MSIRNDRRWYLKVLNVKPHFGQNSSRFHFTSNFTVRNIFIVRMRDTSFSFLQAGQFSILLCTHFQSSSVCLFSFCCYVSVLYDSSIHFLRYEPLFVVVLHVWRCILWNVSPQHSRSQMSFLVSPFFLSLSLDFLFVSHSFGRSYSLSLSYHFSQRLFRGCIASCLWQFIWCSTLSNKLCMPDGRKFKSKLRDYQLRFGTSVIFCGASYNSTWFLGRSHAVFDGNIWTMEHFIIHCAHLLRFISIVCAALDTDRTCLQSLEGWTVGKWFIERFEWG